MFFSDELGIKMTLFSPWHLLQIVLTVVVIYLIYRYRKSIREYKYEHRVRYAIGTTLLLLEVSLHLFYLYNNDYHWKHMLPLELCAINVYVATFIIFTKNRAVFSVVYFWGFGALLSVVFPDIEFGPDRYRYFQFFTAHEMFWWIYMYMIFVHRYFPTVKEFYRSCLLLLGLAVVFIIPINLLLDQNYMFVMNGGVTPMNILEVLGPIGYTLSAIVVFFIIASIWYAPVYYFIRKNRDII